MPTSNETTDWLATIDYGADPSSYGYLQPGYTATGSMSDASDVDLIKVPLAVGQTYDFSVIGNGVTARLLDDMSATNFGGTTLSFDPSHPSEWYFVEITGTGSYTVTLDGLAADTIKDEDTVSLGASSAPDFAYLDVGQIRSGVINGNVTSQDVDHFRTVLSAGTTYHWNMTPVASPYGATAGGWLTLLDADGVDVGAAWSGSAWTDGASLTYTPETTGEYYIAAQTYGFNYAGSYEISVTRDGDIPSEHIVGIQSAKLSTNASGRWAMQVNLELPESYGDANVVGKFQIAIPASDGSAAKTIIRNYDLLGSEFQGVHFVTLGKSSKYDGTPGAVVSILTAENAVIDHDSAHVFVDFDGVRMGGDGKDNVLVGSNGDDVLHGFRGADLIKGLAGNDYLNGGSGKDRLVGGDGLDRLNGGAHSDVLNGGADRDIMSGKGGKDTLIAGSGTDRLTGGTGADKFVFSSNNNKNTIMDFELGLDKIRIKSAAVSGIDDLNFIASGDNTYVRFEGTKIVLLNVTVAEAQDIDNFLF